MAAVVWLVLGVLLVAAEVLSGDLVLVMLGTGALLAGGATAIGASAPASVAVFAVSAAALVLAARPPLRRKLADHPHLATGVHALVGGRAVVLERTDAHGGRVKIGGEVWSARCSDEGQVFEPGTSVMVLGISGATAVVCEQP
jgi:membrane protein implicated in regulation of membrane protease activity